MFGKRGQDEIAKCRVGIIGLGGIGSLVAEFLARLGVGKFCLIDDDRVERQTCLGSQGILSDAKRENCKSGVARRLILQGNEGQMFRLIQDDVAKESVAKELTSCDYLFLAADSMRARFVFNALVHQYLIPGVQLGSKIRSDPKEHSWKS